MISNIISIEEAARMAQISHRQFVILMEKNSEFGLYFCKVVGKLFTEDDRKMRNLKMYMFSNGLNAVNVSICNFLHNNFFYNFSI